MKDKPLIVLSALVCLFLYIVLHEFGHTIVLWSVGAEVTEFSIINAHVNYTGGQWTNLSDLWMHLNGALFPIIISIVYLLLYKPDLENRLYRIFSGFVAIIPPASLLAWVFIPIMYMAGTAPEGDDVYKFLYNFTFDHPAYLVTICSLALMGFCIFLGIKKKVYRNFWSTLRQPADDR